MRWRPSLLLLLSAFSLFLVGAKVTDFRICAYNVPNFNLKKASNHRALHTLTKVVSRCDICLLQHVVDSDGKAIKALLTKLNRYDGHRYNSVSSKSLGNSPSDMQQYVFIYREDRVNLTGQHQYERKQSFVREPFVVRFQSNKTEINEFILVPLHSEPAQAVEEIDRLYDVFEEVSAMWENQNVMFLGDFHAGCAYVTRNDRKRIRLYTNTSFSWLIRDREDTTVTDSTNCAYDRIVVHGQSFLKTIEPLSGKVFNIAEEFKFRKRTVLAVSDHFPVEVILKSSSLLLQATPLLLLLSVPAAVQFFLPAL
ncbi:deoxyribonuclease gamma-like isoform 2-T2 [Odontesthes bonariensis]|uniref:deoxyribonuclease gamma-like isoform X2 n=1 Tax=Odontesthes bonariensis TaxID=219752 RepID=UPI003F5884E9